MSEEINTKYKFTIVGGGTAGLISALVLKKRLDCDVTIIKSDKIGIIGVGEGSTEHWDELIQVLGIDYKDLIKQAECTVKLGVYFEGWTKVPYFHNVTDFQNIQLGQHQSAVAMMYANDSEQVKITDNYALENLVSNVEGKSPTKQYHFNTFKLNNYLLQLCKDRNIQVHEDEIINVSTDKKGIKSIEGQKRIYNSDFWIDCTGFNRLLISKLDCEWQSYEKYLKLNHAIAFQTDDTNEYTPYTLAKAMEYGWLWRIPVQGRWGNGYIFDDNYIDADQAKEEVEKVYGHKIQIGKNIKFFPGALKQPWIKNCMAVGLSANFVEPLEATSIGTSINQMFLFLHYWIPNYHLDDIKEFNYKMQCIMNNIRDFVFLHYLVDRDDTDFWKDVKNIPLPDSLNVNLKKWSRRLPIAEDFTETNFLLFKERNFASVLYGIGFYNKEQVNLEFEKFNKELVAQAKQEAKNYLTYYNIKKKSYISHKEWLTNLLKIN